MKNNGQTAPLSRRRFLRSSTGICLSLGSSQLVRGSSHWEAPPVLQSGTNPLGPRWPKLSQRFFYGRAADFQEMKQAYEKIEPGDVQAFVTVWISLARSNEQRAERAAARGHNITARDYFLRASNYYSFVRNLFLRLGKESQIVDPHGQMLASFRRAWEQAEAPFERVQIPFGDKVLPGFFFAAQNRKAARGPAVVELSGIDHIKERAFFRSQWIPYTERGLNYLTLDGPGQGELLVNNTYFRPDMEVAGRKAIDYLVKRKDVDPRRIGIFSTSFGAYFALRTAASDTQVKAVACRSSVYDALEDAYDFCPWIREHLRLLVNAATAEEAREKLGEFTLKGVARKIRCPVFITHGSLDDIVSVNAARKLEAEIQSEDKTIRVVEGAGHFPGAEIQVEQVDWMAAIL